MISEEKQIVVRAVENYIRTGNTDGGEAKVTLLPGNKTSFVEQVAGDGRSIMLDEYRVDGRVIWAGYSARTGMVYLSPGR